MNILDLPEIDSLLAKSELLSSFPKEKVFLLITTLKYATYVAAHPETSGTKQPDLVINSFMQINPDLVQVYARVAFEIFTSLKELGPDPSHENFAASIYTPLGGLFAIAGSGELNPSLDQIDKQMDTKLFKSLIDRTLTIVWILFYPDKPLADGSHLTLEEYSAKLNP